MARGSGGGYGWRLAALFACGIVVALIGWWPMIKLYPHTPELDGHYCFYQLEIGKASLLRYGELPLWNPFDCRGVPNWDHPEAMTASPLLLLTAPLPALYQYYLFVIVHCAVGFVGMWLLARDDVKLSRTATFVAAASFALAASHTFQYAGGHLTFVGFWNLPLLFFLWRRAERNLGSAIGVGIVLALMIYEGGTYPVPFCILALCIETLTRMTSKSRLVDILGAGAVVGVSTFLLSAARLLPLADQFSAHKRPNWAADVDVISAKNLWAMLTLRSLGWSNHLEGSNYVFNEYVTYIGLAGVAMLVLGAFLAIKRAPWVVVVGCMVLLVMIGHFSRFAPWALLNQYVFPFKSMRVPSRFRLVLSTPIALCFAIAVEETPKLLLSITGKPRFADAGRAFVLAVTLLAAGDAVGFGISKIEMHFNGAAPQKVQASERFHYGGPGLASDYVDQPKQNRAWLGCRSYEWVFHDGAPLWQGDVPQAKAAGEGVAVEVANRTHNTFTLDVVVSGDKGRVHLNSAYDVGWRSSVGTVVEDNHLLALDLPNGRHRVKMHYWPRRLTLGFVLTGIGVAGVVAFFVVRRRRRATRPSSSR